MTALAATVGTGNIVGVATAILAGGPGAVFWMWCTALVGMATKFAETVLAVHYREVTPAGNVVGGPMYYIKNGLGPKWTWMGTAFAIFGGIACFGIGNMTQSNAISGSLATAFGISPKLTAAVIFILLAVVILGGVSRIGAVSGKLVPLMAAFYIACSLVIIAIHIEDVPRIFVLIIEEAFTPTAAQGGFLGATVWMAIRYGVARGVFSNEAGLGSAAIAPCHSHHGKPCSHGFHRYAGHLHRHHHCMQHDGLFHSRHRRMDSPDANGAALTSVAFNAVLPGAGSFLVTISLAFFAFSTILGWCVYGERCWVYLLGDRALKPFRIIFTIVAPIGALSQLDTVWTISDTFNALMAIPNLIGLLLLTPVVLKLVKEDEKKLEEELRNKGL